MQTIRLVGEIDHQHRLIATVPETLAPGSVEILVIARGGSDIVDDADVNWSAGIAHEWQAELGDPREDIYTLEDGVPSDGPR